MRRSTWPNLSRDELARRVERWADAQGHSAVVIWETTTTADDTIAERVRELQPPIWVVTSDRGLRGRVDAFADRILGGGTFVRTLEEYAES